MTTRSSQVIGDKFVLGAEVERWYQAHAGEHNWLQKFVEQKFPRAVPVKLRGDRDAWNKLRTEIHVCHLPFGSLFLDL